MKIRRSEGSDLKFLVEIYNESRNSVECFSDADISVEGFKFLIKGEDIYVATVDDCVVGFVSVWAANKFIHHLYVAPSHQNMGVAKLLINVCISCYGFPLSLKSVITNTKACEFYQKNNWVAESTHNGPEGFYHYYWLRA